MLFYVAFIMKNSTPAAGAESPMALFKQLERRPEAPDKLHARQRSVLGAYMEKLGSKDLAFEMPTGSGKTLVGCLIAEWRRRSKNERVAYLAPTRQLAQQAARLAELYGVPAVDLTGKHTEWAGTDLRFVRKQAVAFATFNAVFNSSPKMAPQAIVLDDAHAAESPVASTWSVRIERRWESATYDQVVEVLTGCGAFSAAVARRLHHRTAGRVYLAGVAETTLAASKLEQVLEQALVYKPRWRFAYEKLGHTGLAACLVYVNSDEVFIRPVVPPTLSHKEFEDAAQRIYMSATLGTGGELERAFGRRRIDRIELDPVALASDAESDNPEEGNGRRFFCFPSLTPGLGDDRLHGFVREQIDAFGKALVIARSEKERTQLVKVVAPVGMPQWATGEADDAPEEFRDAERGLLAAANRYDGIDLPGDTCRLIVMHGCPTGAHLQERFLYESLGADTVLNERIRTRLIQGAGRATRGSEDRAAIIMLGRDLQQFCATHLDTMPAEIRAEINFGLEQEDLSEAGLREALATVSAGGADWAQVDEFVREREQTDDRPHRVPEGTPHLQTAARFEVEAANAAWHHNWERAVERARKAIEALAGGDSHYRALWQYLAGAWAVLAAQGAGGSHWAGVAGRSFDDARVSAQGTQWLSELNLDAIALLTPDSQAEVTALDPLDEWVIDQIADHALRTDMKPLALEQKIRDGLGQTDSTLFEHGLIALGELMGAEVLQRSSAHSEPDAVWMFGEHFWLAIEAKSGATGSKIASRKVREALTHLNYAAGVTDREVPEGSVILFVTPQTDVAHDARLVATGRPLFLVTPEPIQQIAERVLAAWGAIRSQTSRMEPIDARPVVANLLSKRQALPSQWLALVTSLPITVA
ncbi:DEAD/DEAH box helicase family protein [Streptomyces sp. ACA25]|uniref:DEAD/DEAH box helicase n=1 Tax=Streptomyces sp. ACA25 TaxID=3022596 RepID=UPI002307C58B|nr:DEAD/DEAH box helicase [Streptomyces sp. ACA25]MDB1086181.1 DEAD/DEAH box helicase family protein [Streptomyces sp. ACA25]